MRIFLIVSLRIILFLCIIYVIIIFYFFLFQRKLIYAPSREIESTPATIGLPYEEVFISTADNISICGWYVPAEKAKGTVLFFHGNAGNISSRLHRLQTINSMSLNVLIIDYRGYGKSGGKPSEQGLQADAIAAWNFLIQMRKEKPERIVLFGHSLGGAVAAFLASKVNPAGLIIEGAFTSIPDMGALLYPYLPIKLLSREKHEVSSYIKNISCPILIAHSREDEITPFDMGQKLFNNAKEPKFFFELSGRHSDSESITSSSYYHALNDFIKLAIN